MSEIQAVLFNRKKYSSKKAKSWLKLYNLKPIKRVHKTKKYLRYRIKNPFRYTIFRTKKINSNIKIIFGLKEA